MKISNLTGLPELPEGQYWRVGQSGGATNRLGFSLFGDPIGAYVEIRERGTKIEEVDKTFNIFGREFVHGTEEKEVETDECVFREFIKRRTPFDVTVYGEDESEPIGVRESFRENYVQAHELTREDILQTVLKLLTRRDEEAKSKELLGDYPPKNLFDSEDGA